MISTAILAAVFLTGLAMAPAASANTPPFGNFYVLETDSGKEFYVMRLQLLVECPSKSPYRVRDIRLIEGDSEKVTDWGQLPAFDLVRHPRGYRIIDGVRKDSNGEPVVLGYAEVPGEYFDVTCSHFIRAEGIGFNRKFDIDRLKWPMRIWDRQRATE